MSPIINPSGGGGGGGGSQAVLLGSKSLTSAQLLALDTVPVQLLAAPGGRKYYVVHGIVLHYRFVATPYTGTFAPLIGYGTTVAEIYNNGGSDAGPGSLGDPIRPEGKNAGVGLVGNTQDAYGIEAWLPILAGGYSWSAWLDTETENKAVSIMNGGGDPLLGGDGTVTVRTFYSVIDGAP